MATVTQISLEALLLRATSPTNSKLNTAAVEAFFSLINKERDGPAIGVKIIAAKLPTGSEKEVLYTLNILDMCMCRCGTPFQNEVGKFRFLNEMIKLVSPKYLGSRTPISIKQKILQLLYLWTLDYPREVKIKEAFDMLRKQGVTRDIPNPNIPQEAIGYSKRKFRNSIFHDEQKSNILKKLLQSKDPEDIQAANWLIKSMVKEDEKITDLKSKAACELESVQNNIRLLYEMMDSYKRGVTTNSELDLMNELYDNLVRLSPNLTKIMCEMEHCPPDLMECAVKTMDHLEHCVARFNVIMYQPNNDVNPDSNLASLLELDQQAVGYSGSPLIQLNQQKKKPTEYCSIENDYTENSVDVFYDNYSDIDNVLEKGNILQPLPISTNDEKVSSEKDKEKHDKNKALEDLDILEQHLIKENLPVSNYRNHQEKVPMNLLTKINDIKKSQQKQHEQPNTDTCLDLNCYLLEKTSLSDGNSDGATSCQASAIDNSDDCLVDISDGNDENHTRSVESLAKSNLSLKDISVKLEDIKPSGNKPIIALEEKNGVTIVLHLAKERIRDDVSIYVITTVNRNEMGLSNYLFQAVVPKGCKVKLQSPSSNELPAFNPFLPPAAITQIMLISNPEHSNLFVKFVVSYVIDDDLVTEMGEIVNLPF